MPTGQDAAGIKQALEGRASRSSLWSSKIRGYRQSQSVPPTERTRGNAKGVGVAPAIGDSGASALAEEMHWIGDAESKALDRILNGLVPALRRRLDGRWFDEDKEALETDYGYFPGAAFDSFRSESDDEDWYEGKKRALSGDLSVLHGQPLGLLDVRQSGQDRRSLRTAEPSTSHATPPRHPRRPSSPGRRRRHPPGGSRRVHRGTRPLGRGQPDSDQRSLA